MDTIVVSVSGQVGESHIRSLCNLVPGLVSYECKPASGTAHPNSHNHTTVLAWHIKSTVQCFVSGMAYVRYVSPDCAAFAVDRLHGFEYPIGFPLSVSFAKPGSQHSRSMVLLCCNGRCVFRRRAARRVRNEVAARSSLGRLRRSTTGRRRTEGSGCVYLTSEC